MTGHTTITKNMDTKRAVFVYKRRHPCIYTTVNNRGYILHKARNKKKGRKHDYDVYKKGHPCTSKQVVNVFDVDTLV
jgi:hypothetical protein